MSCQYHIVLFVPHTYIKIEQTCLAEHFLGPKRATLKFSDFFIEIKALLFFTLIFFTSRFILGKA